MTHYGLRDFYVDLRAASNYKVTLHMELQSPFDGFVDFQSESYQIYVDPWFTRVEIVCYTPNVTKTLLEIITKLTK